MSKRQQYLRKPYQVSHERISVRPKDFKKKMNELDGSESSILEYDGLLGKIKDGYSQWKASLSSSQWEKETQSFSVRFAFDTNKTQRELSLAATKRLLREGKAPKGRPFWQWGITPLQDLGEAEAQLELFTEILRSKNDLSLQTILRWHDKIFSATKPSIAGKIRKHQSTISGSRFTPPSPLELSALMRDLFAWYKTSKGKIHPVELAALMHLKLVSAHPFVDGNGRIARLAMNFILFRNGYPMFKIPYEWVDGYYRAIEESQVNNCQEAFLAWFARAYVIVNARYSTSELPKRSQKQK
jgi:fido (protein-threonine AMPylation protein)